ncbi:MAG: GNAT family N-acetyltransferase [Burkholderiaceae bacterium]|nr:MAG: GNAT family N-acetyltransferase [Burkholderiaceae bacterium]
MQTNRLAIRRAELNDAPRISDLVVTLAPYFTIQADGQGAEVFLESVNPQGVQGFLESTQFDYFIAEYQGQIAGVVALRDNSHLYHLFVAPSFHGLGFGRQLWEFIVDFAKHKHSDHPVTAMTVNSSIHALAMYQHFGFVATAERQELHGIAFVPMRIDL